MMLGNKARMAMHVICVNFKQVLTCNGAGRISMAVVLIPVQVMIYRRLQIVRDDHLDQSEAYDIS